MSRIVTGILIALGYILLIPLAPFAVRIVQEYERGADQGRVGSFRWVSGGLPNLLGAAGNASSPQLRPR